MRLLLLGTIGHRTATTPGDTIRRILSDLAMQTRGIRLLLLLIPLTLACNFAYGFLEDATGVSLGEEPGVEEAPPSAPIELPEPDDPRSDAPSSSDTPSTSDAAPDESIPPETRDQMDQIEGEVILLRGLMATGRVDRGLLSSDELREYVLDDFLEDYTEEEAADDAWTLALMGFLEPDYDLFQLYLDLYSEQVAGFYDDDIKQMFVIQDSEFEGPQRLTYAHEYAHALQDQNYDLDSGLRYNDEACEEEGERCAAVQALLEGDATLLEERWLLTYASERDFNQLREFYETFESPVFESTPAFLQEDFLFPYQFGYSFVEHFFLDGGWAAIDDVYADPPVSTEQILHPRLYPEERPVALEVPELTDALGSRFREIDRDVLGEWFTLLLLKEQVLEELAQEAAEGWGGDYYLAFYNETDEQGALVLLTTWDTVRDAHQFYGAFRDYGEMRFGERTLSTTTFSTWETAHEWASVEISGDQTLWILAPDTAAGEALREAIPFPAALAE